MFPCVDSRPVQPSDIQGTEKKLLQTLDMILVKKRRLVVTSRDSSSNKRGFWSILTRNAGSKYFGSQSKTL